MSTASWLEGAMVCFDLDDTLSSEVDYVESGLRAVAAMLEQEGLARKATIGSWFEDEWRRTAAHDLFQQACFRLGLDCGWVKEMVRVYREHRPEICARRGSTEVLRSIVDAGGRLSIVSDGYLISQRKKWCALDLRFPFSPVIFTDARGPEYWKPHPWAFEEVMRCVPRCDRFAYVGDNAEKDFLAPNTLGWTTVQLRDAKNLHRGAAPPGGEPKLVVEDFISLLEALAGDREWLSRGAREQ